jgi:hypothetical protein
VLKRFQDVSTVKFSNAANFFNPAAMLDYLLVALTAPNSPSVRIYIHGDTLAIRPDSSERIGPPTAFNDRDVVKAAVADNAPCLIAGQLISIPATIWIKEIIRPGPIAVVW